MRDRDITVPVVDYGIPRRDRPSLKMVSYQDLKSGTIELNGMEVASSSLSSFQMAREVARTLKEEVEKGRLVRWWIEGAEINWELGLAQLSGGYESPIMQKFAALAQKAFASDGKI